MPYDESRKAWDKFQTEFQGLTTEMKRHYRDAEAVGKTAELDQAVEQLRQAADRVFWTLESAGGDPVVKSRTKEAARTFGAALTETFRELSYELEKALKKPAATA